MGKSTSGAQDPAGASVDPGRGGRGRVRGRGPGRYDQDFSGGRGRSDSYSGRGPGTLAVKANLTVRLVSVYFASDLSGHAAWLSYRLMH